MRRLVLEAAGWLLVAGGLAALILPGPGLLMLFAGLVLLSQQYEWARRRLQPVRRQALRTASDSVQTWPRIAGSSLGGLLLVCLGVLWGLKPPPPGWWPLSDRWWLPGGWGTGVSLILSGVVALLLIGYSLRRFRHAPFAAEDEAA